MSQTSAQIEAAIAASDKPIILEFHGSHCTPCITQEDLLLHASVHPSFPAKVVSINVEELPEYADHYGVKSVPSVVLVQNGKTKAHFSGLVDAGSVISAIENEQTPQGRD